MPDHQKYLYRIYSSSISPSILPAGRIAVSSSGASPAGEGLLLQPAVQAPRLSGRQSPLGGALIGEGRDERDLPAGVLTGDDLEDDEDHSEQMSGRRIKKIRMILLIP